MFSNPAQFDGGVWPRQILPEGNPGNSQGSYEPREVKKEDFISRVFDWLDSP